MEYGDKVLQEKNWIPVPDEGWNIEAATAGNPAVQFLNGTWNFTIRERNKEAGFIRIEDDQRFAWDDTEGKLLPQDNYQPDPFEEDFYRRDPEFKDWKPIPVPANWETEAMSKQIFAHCSLDLDNVVGYYRRTFKVPEEWMESGQVILQAEGIAASAEIYVNEERVIYHDGGFIPFQVDISDYLKSDTDNLIAIKVVKADISTVHDNSGQWMLSGIYKDIFLFHVPEVYVSDFGVITDYDDTDSQGSLDLKLQLNKEIREECKINTILYKWDQEQFVKEVTTPLKPGTDDINIQINYLDIQPWNPEEPFLYKLECQLIIEGRVVERVREEIGFYRITGEEGIFKLNGKHIVIQGVTRHQILQTRGRALTTGDMIKEIRMMKEANVTGVRSHPYPFDTRFIKLCARYGLLVATEYCLCGYNCWGNPWAISEEKTYPEPETEFDQGYRMLFNERYHYFAP